MAQTSWQKEVEMRFLPKRCSNCVDFKPLPDIGPVFEGYCFNCRERVEWDSHCKYFMTKAEAEKAGVLQK